MRILAGVGTGEDTGLPPDGSPVKITGRIDTRSSEEIILKSISIIQNDQEYSYSGKLQCELENMKTAMITAGAVTEEEKTLKIGQQIVLEGTFALFSTATNPGEFDAQAYYAAKGIGGRVRKAQILAAGEKYSFLREKLYGFRQVLHDRLAEVFPAKEASVMQTLLLGEKEELDAEVKALYQKNGIAHILSISGLHITLLGMGVYRLLKRLGLPVRAAAVGGAMLLLIYGVMVGMSVSASRAIGMYLLQMLGIFVGRTYDMLTGLGLMALLLVLQEPERLFDVSFLMSFGAVLGICILTPVFSGGCWERDADAESEVKGISTWLRTVADILGDSAYERNKYREGWRKVAYEEIRRMVSAVKGGFAASVGVILFTLPVQLWFFYEIPVYSVLLNLLVLPFMSAVVAGGILSLIPGLGIVGTVDCLILWWYEWICERFGELPGAVWCVGQPERWQIACYYAGIFLLVFGRKYVEAWKKRGTYGEENVPGDRLHSARTPWCLITRGADESIRNRKSAAGVMKEYGCSDDGFIDFRAWLIAQGRDTYLSALADPDSLAEVIPYGDCCFETLSYVGDYAYEQLTGKSAYDQTDWARYETLLADLEQDIVYKGGIEFPREGLELKQYLPRLCAAHPGWDGKTRWNVRQKEMRDLIRAGKAYDQRQAPKKKHRSHGGEVR